MFVSIMLGILGRRCRIQEGTRQKEEREKRKNDQEEQAKADGKDEGGAKVGR